jgi:hypothetical protein
LATRGQFPWDDENCLCRGEYCADVYWRYVRVWLDITDWSRASSDHLECGVGGETFMNWNR